MEDLQRDTRVSQAVGMIAVQSDCTVDVAETKLRGRAAGDGRLVENVALDVIERRIQIK